MAQNYTLLLLLLLLLLIFEILATTHDEERKIDTKRSKDFPFRPPAFLKRNNFPFFKQINLFSSLLRKIHTNKRAGRFRDFYT